MVAKIRDLAAKWRTRWLDPFVETVKAGDPAIGAEVVDSSEALYLPIEKALDDLETLTAARHDSARAEIAATAPRVALLLLPVGLIAVFVFALNGGWLVRSISGPLRRLNETARDLVAGASVTFKAERDDEVGALANILERLRVDASDRYNSARLEASRAATFNQLAELTSFAQDEDSLVEAAVKTLRRIAPTPRGHIMLVNNSTNRLIVAAGWGDGSPTPGEPSPINRIDRCPGIRRATAYVSADLSDDMSVRCPAHPVETGSVVCLPMPALGSIVGVIHLERPEPNSFDSETVQISARVAEQVALAIANARLMKTMEGLAMTDPLTGLRNARFFDQFLEQEFASGERDGESTAVIMLDVDHFKRFNDTYGHPAGDEALRALARSLRSLVRASDVVARYGGEEFIIALHHTTMAEARVVAEKIRAGIEQTVVEIGPGRYARVTISLGTAGSDIHKVEPKGIVSLADAALYQAKEQGRNRVESAPSSEAELSAAARRRAGKSEAHKPVELRAS